MFLRLDTNLQYLKGVGPKLGAVFNKRGMKTIGDLLEFYPRAYEDRRAARNIASLKINDIVSLKARVVGIKSIPMGRSNRKIFEIIIQDSSGSIPCKYFRVPYKGYFERFTAGKEIRVIGKVVDYRGRKEFHHPDLRDIDPNEEEADKLIPIYTEIEGVSSAKLQKLIELAIHNVKINTWPIEKFPEWILKEYNLLTHKQAIEGIHDPEVEKAKEYIEGKSQAHHRIIFEEFFWLELFLAANKTGFKKENAPKIQNNAVLVNKFISQLPFQITGAQERAFADIQKDLAQYHPMHRLVQGDVGSGKTLVAFLAALYASESKYQSCLMAPTEILAEQHFTNAKKLLEPFGLRCGILTGKTKASEKKQILIALRDGLIDLLIGTHALIEEDVVFSTLGLVIIDEQHRFGVEQRGKLKQKGESPHFLVMTATPIPRTLAMTVYGDLDVTIIDEMPKGRAPIQTRVIFENKKPQALDFMSEQLKRGRQAYIVYPLVEESEKIDLKDAVSEFEYIKKQFPQYKCGLIHGKLKSDEKERVMNAFRKNEIQILVSTTVIEVGVDVPNANIMIIEHAERFGLSQLHQLRGRVGRGEHKSFCILIMGRAVSEEARARTSMMEKSSDGFKIAEFDLELRGPGEFLGTRQSGLPGFKMANLVRDIQILQEAREAAFKVLEKDPKLSKIENKELRDELLRAHGPAALASIG